MDSTQITALSDKFAKVVAAAHAFVNGTTSTTIATEHGIIPSLSKIAEVASQSRPVQFVEDYPTLTHAIASNRPAGTVARVLTVTPGYYQINGAGGADKISYSDLFDLRDVEQNPMNKDYIECENGHVFAQVRLPASSTNIGHAMFRFRLTSYSAIGNAMANCIFVDGVVRVSTSGLTRNVGIEYGDRTTHFYVAEMSPPSIAWTAETIGQEHVFDFSISAALVGPVDGTRVVFTHSHCLILEAINTKKVKTIHATTISGI